MNGKIEFPYHTAFISGRDYTIEAWLRTCPNPAGDFEVYSRIDPGGTENKYLRVYADGSVAGMYQDLLGAELRTNPGVLPFDQAWHHVAFVIDDGPDLASVYVDGAQTETFPLAPLNVGNAVGLPATVGGGATGWQVSELRVSVVARYDALTHVIDESWISDADTVLLLGFDEPAGATVVSDGSSHAMLGTVIGDVYFGLTGLHGDADGEGLGDDDELLLGSSPFDRDSDDDGVDDFVETDAVYAFGQTDLLTPDSDGDGIQDGTELGVVDGVAGDPVLDILGTDLGLFVPDADGGATVTDPTDLDSDDDGFEDGQEDLDFNGAASATELDAAKVDTDGDFIQDGTESSLTVPGPFTDPAVFVPDADPATQTDPLDPDSDGGSPWDGPLTDGKEDLNRNGAYEPGLEELDPLHNADDHFQLSIPYLVSGQPYSIVAWEARPFSTVFVLYTRHGGGPSYIPSIDLSVGLDPLYGRYDFPLHADAGGDAVHFATLPEIGTGFPVFYQGVEIASTPTGLSFRLSYLNSVLVQ